MGQIIGHALDEKTILISATMRDEMVADPVQLWVVFSALIVDGDEHPEVVQQLAHLYAGIDRTGKDLWRADRNNPLWPAWELISATVYIPVWIRNTAYPRQMKNRPNGWHRPEPQLPFLTYPGVWAYFRASLVTLTNRPAMRTLIDLCDKHLEVAIEKGLARRPVESSRD